jgi:hypothetical protein
MLTIIEKLDEIGLEKTGGNFYDLGSGMGKPVFAAMLNHDFHKCVGLEVRFVWYEGFHKRSNAPTHRFLKVLLILVKNSSHDGRR